MGELRSKGRWSLINEIASYPGAALRRVIACFSSVISSIREALDEDYPFEKCTFFYSRRALWPQRPLKAKPRFPFSDDIQRVFRLYRQ